MVDLSYNLYIKQVCDYFCNNTRAINKFYKNYKISSSDSGLIKQMKYFVAYYFGDNFIEKNISDKELLLMAKNLIEGFEKYE